MRQKTQLTNSCFVRILISVHHKEQNISSTGTGFSQQ